MITYMTVLEKAAITGGMTGLASMITTGAGWRVPCPQILGFGSGACPLYVYAAVAGCLASAAADGVHYLVRNEIPINQKAQDEGSLYLAAIMGAASYWGVMYLSNPFLARDIGTATLLITGMAAEAGASLIYAMIQ